MERCQLFVKTISGTTIPINVEHNSTVYDTKLCIARQLNEPLEKLRLIYAGEELSQDQCLLVNYNIKPGATIYLLFRINFSNDIDLEEDEKIDKVDGIDNYTYDIKSLPKLYRNKLNDPKTELVVTGYINRLKAQLNSPYVSENIKHLCKRFYHINGSIKILIKWLTGDTETFDNIWPNYTIKMLKQMFELYANKSYSYKRQRLIVRGKQLHDDKLISEYKITDGETIYMLLKLHNNSSFSSSDSDSLETLYIDKNKSVFKTEKNVNVEEKKEALYPLGTVPSKPKHDPFMMKIAWHGQYINKYTVHSLLTKVKQMKQTIFENIKEEYDEKKTDIDFEADDLILYHYMEKQLDANKSLVYYIKIYTGDAIWVLKKNGVNDFETNEQKMDYVLRELSMQTRVSKKDAEQILNFEIKPEHIPIMKKSEEIADGILLKMLVEEWGLIELKTYLTVYTHPFVVNEKKEDTLFYHDIGIKYGLDSVHSSLCKACVDTDKMNWIEYKVVELDVDEKEKNEIFCKWNGTISVKKRANYKIYFREIGKSQFKWLQTLEGDEIDECYSNYLHDHLEINHKHEIVFKFYREDTNIDISVMREILAAKYQIKCPNHNNKAQSVVFGYLRRIQVICFDNYNNSYFNIPKGIYLMCLGMVDDHFSDNSTHKFDNINDFKIPINGHTKCIMPTFRLYALPKGYDKQILIKTFPLDDKMINIHYEYLSVIGRGGFGKVMQVKRKDNNNDKIYALKIINKNNTIRKHQVEHTRTERKIYTQINHPFLMKCHNMFETKTKLYFVLDFAIGGDLFFHIKLKQKFNEDITRVWCAEVALALGHLHSLGIALRTIKPEDIVLDINGHLQLTDFGLSKYLQPNTKAHTFCGTPEYLAPEVVTTTHGHDKNVDWWCLGLLLYELTAGIPPFYDQNVNEMYKKILCAPLQFPEHLSTEIKDLIHKLLQRDPSKRLGAVNDVDGVKQHPFFDSIDWDKLYRKEISSGYTPKVMGDITDMEDTSNFDSVFLLEAVINSPATAPVNADNLFDPWFACNMQKLQL